MATYDEEVLVAVRADLKNFKNDLKQMNQMFKQAGNQSKNSFSAVNNQMKSISKEGKKSSKGIKKSFETTGKAITKTMKASAEATKKAFEGVKKTVSGISKVAMGVGAAGLAAGAVIGKKGIDFTSNMEQSMIAWETLEGGVKEAKKMIADLQKFGRDTPFEFEGVDKTAKLLKAMGVQSKDVIPYMTAIGDAVSAVGGGQDTLNGISLALGQMITKGKVSAEEMNQLAERGIGAWEILSQAYGRSKEELMDMGSRGLLRSDEIVPVLIQGLNKNYGGAMEKQSKTFQGMISAMKDDINIIMGKLAEPLFGIMKDALPHIQKFVSAISDQLLTGDYHKAFMKTFWKIRDVIDDTIIASIKVIRFLQPAFQKITPVIKNVFYSISNFGKMIFQQFVQILPTALDVIAKTFSFLVVAIQKGISIIKTVFQSIGTFMNPIVEKMKDFGGIFINGVKNAIPFAKQLFASFQTVMDLAKQLFDAFADIIPKIAPLFLIVREALMNVFFNVFPKVLDIVMEVIGILSSLFKDFVSSMVPLLQEGFYTIGKIIKKTLLPAIKDLAPIFKNVFGIIVGILQNIVFPVIRDLVPIFVNAFRAVSNLIKNTLIPTFEALVPVIKEAFEIAGEIIRKTIMPALNQAIPIIQKALGLLGVIITDQVLPALRQLAPAVKEGLGFMANIMKNLIIPTIKALAPLFIQAFAVIWNVIKNAIVIFKNIAKAMNDFFKSSQGVSIFQTIVSAIQMVASKVGEMVNYIVARFTELIPKIQQTLAFLGEILMTAFGFLKSLWDQWGEGIMATVSNVFTYLLDFITGAVEIIKGIFQIFIAVFKGDWETAWEGIKSVFLGVWEIIKSYIKNILPAIVGIIKNGVGLILKLIVGLSKNLIDIIFGGLSYLVKNLDKILLGIIKGVGFFIGNLLKLFIHLPNELFKIGKWIVGGLWEGILSMKEYLFDRVGGLFGSLVKGIKKSLGIHSPSRLFKEEIGRNMILGAQEGINEQKDGLEKDTMGAFGNLSEIAKEKIEGMKNHLKNIGLDYGIEAGVKVDQSQMKGLMEKMNQTAQFAFATQQNQEQKIELILNGNMTALIKDIEARQHKRLNTLIGGRAGI